MTKRQTTYSKVPVRVWGRDGKVYPPEIKMTKRKQEFWIWTIQAAFVATMATTAIVGMGGCSTVEGMGKDLSDAARWTGERMDNGLNRPED